MALVCMMLKLGRHHKKLRHTLLHVRLSPPARDKRSVRCRSCIGWCGDDHHHGITHLHISLSSGVPHCRYIILGSQQLHFGPPANGPPTSPSEVTWECTAGPVRTGWTRLNEAEANGVLGSADPPLQILL